MIELYLYLFILLELAILGVWDIRTRKIPNQFIALNMALYLGLLLTSSISFSWAPIVYAAAFVFVGFILYMLNLMGGGDSKLLATLFLLCPHEVLDSFLIHLLVTTSLIGGFSLITNFIQNYERIYSFALGGHKEALKRCFETRFPYVPVIWLAWAWLGFSIF